MRIRYSLLNFATAVLFTAITMAMGLFASPWLELWLGRERFGAFRIVVDGLGSLTLLQFGLGEAMAPMVARAIGHGDDRALRQAMAAGMRAYFRVSLVIVAVGAVLTAGVDRLVSGLPPAGVADLRGAWLLGLLGMLSLGLAPLRTFVDARQRGHQVNLLLIGQSLLITGAALLLARGGWGITGQSLANLLGLWAFSLALAVLVARDRRDLLGAVWSLSVDRETRRALWCLGAASFLINVSNRISLMTDNLVIGKMLGAGAVTTLFFTQRLAVLVQMLMAGIGSAVWAGLAELHALGEHETFNRRLVELSRLVAVLSVAALGPIVAFNRQFVGLWMRPGFVYGGDAIIITAAINAILLPQLLLWSWCFSVTGQARWLVAPSLVGAAVNLAASVLLTHLLGLVGPLLGTTVSFVAVSLWYLPRRLHRVFGTSTAALSRAVASPLAWGGIYTVGLWWAARHAPPVGWLGLAAAMGLAALGFLALAAAILLRAEDRALWRLRLRTLRPGVSVVSSQ